VQLLQPRQLRHPIALHDRASNHRHRADHGFHDHHTIWDGC
jgi:hypothetical protein